MLLACYILTLFATTLLLAGQFVWLAPMLACFTAPLWWQLLRDRRTYSMPLFWLWLAFCALILAQLLNAGSHTQEGGEVILSFPRHDWLPFTLHPRIAFQFLAGWLAAGGLIVAGGMPDVGRRKSDALQACLCLAMTVAIMGIIEHHWHLGFYFNVIPWGAPHFAVFPYINNAGTFFMLATAIALHKGRWAWLLVPLFGYCIWLVDCRAMLGAVGLLVTFAVLQKLKCKVFSIVIILLAGIVFLLFKADELMQDRWQEYVINWRLWLMRPVFGNGVHGNILMAGLGTDWWTGYSFSWLANLAAWAGDGETAEGALDTFASAFVLRNSFHCNGDQSGNGISKFTYRPFTLEGNFAAAAGLNEMLLQSHRGIIQILPAIPRSWDDVSFSTLRASGAFLVSASRKNGRTLEFTIGSETGDVPVVQCPWTGKTGSLDAEAMRTVMNITRDGNTWVLTEKP